MYKFSNLFICVMMLVSCNPSGKNQEKETLKPENGSFYMIVGTYSEPESDGIHVFRFNENTGKTIPVSSLKGISNPSYLQPSIDGKFIYAVAEDDDENAAANTLAFNKESGKLTFLNKQKTNGGAPCYINIDKENRFVVTANYTGGNISVFPLDKEGKLEAASQIINFEGHGIDMDRQANPHLHCVVFSPGQEYLYGVDLGTDAIHFYEVNKDTETNEFLVTKEPYKFDLEAGSGPRHLTFHPEQPFAYLINELSGMVIAFRYTDGILTPIQSIAADMVHARGSADIHITPDGRFLYASNRLKEDGLAIFSINKANGELTYIGYQETGIHPRNFIITPNGKYLLVACRDSNLIQVFEINPATGLLQDTGNNIDVSKPVCLKFVR